MATDERAAVAERVAEKSGTPNIKHICLPHDSEIAWCGFRRTPERPRYYWDQVDEADICVVCLSFPGAREYAMGVTA